MITDDELDKFIQAKMNYLDGPEYIIQTVIDDIVRAVKINMMEGSCGCYMISKDDKIFSEYVKKIIKE